jgi:hypothetical protein
MDNRDKDLQQLTNSLVSEINNKTRSWILLLFAIKMATLPFWAEIKNLRTRHREAYKFVNSGRNDMILSDLERYDVGLPEYVKFITNIYGFRSKEF